MAERNADVPSDRRVEFRIGINLGDIIAEDHDIYGDGVNVAARLEALADPGGVCISRSCVTRFAASCPTRSKIAATTGQEHRPPGAGLRDDPGRHCRDRARRGAGANGSGGAWRYGIVAAVAVAIAAAGGGWWLRPKPHQAVISRLAPTQGTAPRLSIVVLPLNSVHDPDQDYFVDGITEDLTTDLSRIAGSFVIARNTAFTYKGVSVDVRQLGHDLGIRYVLEGSVRRLGNQVQVNVQLIDAGSGAHVWADRFETDRSNLPKAQSEITGRLARR